MKAFFTTLFCVLLATLSAQPAEPCEPTLRPGVHTVQSGETLYGISRAYKITVDDICRWNNLQPNTVLPQCISLWIRQPTTTPDNTPSQPETYSNTPDVTKPAYPLAYRKQSGGKHIVQPGETSDGLARLYGYTTERFRSFNALNAYEVYAGMELRSTDCTCPERGSTYNPVVPVGDSGSNPVQPVTHNNNQGNPDMPYNVERARQQDDVWNRNQTANFEDREMDSAQNGVPGRNVDLGKNPDRYLKKEEMQMIEEINLLRSNPTAYVPHIEAYLAYLRQNGDWTPAVSTAYELIEELKITPQLNLLQPAECLYASAKKHGTDQVKRGYAGHDGSDGSWPWDRVLRECPQLKDGNENLIGGIADPRRAVITLLVDDGVDARGHRKMLLNPEWRYVACFKAGTVGAKPNCWVQVFGR